MKARARVAAGAVIAMLAGCGGGGEPLPPITCDVDGAATLKIGVPDEVDFFLYRPLAPMGEIPMSSSGQAGTGMMLAVEATNLGPTVTVTAMIEWEDPEGDIKVSDFERDGERLSCRDGKLYLVPIILASEFLDLNTATLEGEPVDATVTLTDGDERSVTATASGILTSL